MPTHADLIAAVRAGDVDQTHAILEARPELVNYVAPSTHGHTALHYAVLSRMSAMTRLLMQYGADVHAPTAGIYAIRRLSSPIALAQIRGYDELVEILNEERPNPAQPEEQPAEELGPLRIAIQSNQIDELKRLLKLGLDPDERTRVDGEEQEVYTRGMPLYECARTGKHAMAELLLQHGADPNGQVYASGTPLSEAYGQADDEMVALLERYGGKSNATMAGLYRRPDLAIKLLEEHRDTSLPDDGFGAGPVANQLLAGAARGGDAQILRMALDRVHIPDGDPRWNSLLQAPLGFFNHWTGPWCHPEWDRTTYLACFQMLLEKSGPPNAPLNCGATILHQIVAMGSHVTAEERLSFATAALDSGARLDLRDDLLECTPLGWACAFRRANLVELFLSRGADPNEPTAEKQRHTTIAALLG